MSSYTLNISNYYHLLAWIEEINAYFTSVNASLCSLGSKVTQDFDYSNKIRFPNLSTSIVIFLPLYQAFPP